jgi:hypothetical protein
MPPTGNIPQLQITAGQRIGRSVVTRTGLRTGSRNLPAAELLCDCGQRYIKPLGRLREAARGRGGAKSCGCLRRETGSRNPVMLRTTHGLESHPLYPTWYKIRDRCENPANPRYQDYGGRGIRLHGPWHDVRVFIEDIEATIGPRPPGRSPSGKRPAFTLDRADNNRGYEPGNVRWATWHEQRVNRRTVRKEGAAMRSSSWG